MANIANPDLFACSCWTWIILDIACFYEEQCQPSSESAWPACPNNDKSETHFWGWGVNTICTAVCQTTVTASPRVSWVIWSIWVFRFFVLSWARYDGLLWGCTLSGMVFIILLCFRLLRYVMSMAVCMCFKFFCACLYIICSVNKLTN